MNRRSFVTRSAATFALLPSLRTSAFDFEPKESPIMRALRLLPNRTGLDESAIPITFGANHTLQRGVWPENPEMYWDPLAEDYRALFGFIPQSLDLSSRQEDLSAWIVLEDHFAPQVTLEALMSNGWGPVGETIPLLHYSGSDENRAELAESMNLVGDYIHSGIWDWIALSAKSTIILGADEHLVRETAAIAEGVKSHISVDSAFVHLPYILRPDTYYFGMFSPEELSIDTAELAFVSKSWVGDAPILYSVGMQFISENQVEPMLETLQASQISDLFSDSGIPIGDSIEIVETLEYHNTLRVDFVLVEQS